MKSYTDLEQSKQLAEILPIKSADMWWNFYSVTTDNTTPQIIHLNTPWVGNFNWDNKSDNVPCWSLAALLDVIPQEIFDGEYIINITEGLNNRWILTYDHCENKQHSYYRLSSGADNLVDTCYETIIKLKELNLL